MKRRSEQNKVMTHWLLKTSRANSKDGDPCAIEKLHTPNNSHLIVEAYWEVLETRKGRQYLKV